MSKGQTPILSADRIEKILDRIAIEIVENNFHAGEILLIGISGQGFQMANRLKSLIDDSPWKLKSKVLNLDIDKANPAKNEISLGADENLLVEATIVVVDDVLNTGRTLAYSLSYILKSDVKKVETAVLVNRSHTGFPISATYSGIELSTTLEEHIEVRLDKARKRSTTFNTVLVISLFDVIQPSR